MMFRNEVGQIAGFTKLDGNSKIGFITPLFSVKSSGSLAIQIADPVSDLIVEFRVLADQPAHVIIAPKERKVFVGTPQIYAFDDGSGIKHGTLDDLNKTLRDFLNADDNDVSIRYQISEIIGDHAAGRVLRSKLFTEIQNSLGHGPATYFLQSGIDEQFTKKLSVWHKEKVIDDKTFIEMKTKSRVFRSSRGKVEFSGNGATGYDPKLILDVVSEIESGLQLVSDAKYGVVDPLSSIQKARFEDKWAAYPRQEERIVAILANILVDRSFGLEFAITYRPTAIFENYAKHEIINAFPRGANIESDEKIASNLIAALYSKVFPVNRGLFLYFAAKHLGKYADVKTMIRGKLRKSASRVIAEYEGRIEELLRS